MRVRYGKEVANRSGPESCDGCREEAVEALTGETDRPAIEPRNQESGMPTLLSEAEGNTEHGANRKSCSDPAREVSCTEAGRSHRRSRQHPRSGRGRLIAAIPPSSPMRSRIHLQYLRSCRTKGSAQRRQRREGV